MRYTLILLMIAILLASMTGLTACGDDEYDEFEDEISAMRKRKREAKTVPG